MILLLYVPAYDNLIVLLAYLVDLIQRAFLFMIIHSNLVQANLRGSVGCGEGARGCQLGSQLFFLALGGATGGEKGLTASDDDANGAATDETALDVDGGTTDETALVEVRGAGCGAWAPPPCLSGSKSANGSL